MKLRISTLLIVLLAFIQTAAMATAGTITSAGVEKFITSMELLNQADEKNLLSDIDLDMNDDFSDVISPSGKMIIFTTASEQLKSNPSDHTVLKNITKKSGFSSVSDWAHTGDNIMMVYMRTEMSAKEFEQMKQLTPEMIAMIPQEQRQMLKSAMSLMRAVENVSQADIDTFAPYKKRFDDAMDD